MSESSSASASSLQSDTLKKLHLGCGSVTPSGWVNSDVRPGPSVDLVADLIKGLPVKDESFDAVVSIHAICELGVWDQVPVLKEIHRVLKPGGVLRLSLPDLDVNIRKYQASDRTHFELYMWDTLAGNFITQVLWHSTVRCFYTRDFIEELLRKAGFSQVNHMSFGQTSTPWPVLASLDNRPKESLFVEAVK